jgi:hypothetical protein
MSNSKRKIDAREINFLDALFGSPSDTVELATGSKNVSCELRKVITRAIKVSGKSRHQIAGTMSDLLDIEITKSMLDSWTADSKEGHRFPAAYLPAFCLATDNTATLELLCMATQGRYIKTEDQLRLELGQIQAARLQLQEREREIKQNLRRE